MIIEIQQPVTKEKVQDALKKVSEMDVKKTLRKHFGKLQRGLDGVDYQKNIDNPSKWQKDIRDEWGN